MKTFAGRSKFVDRGVQPFSEAALTAIGRLLAKSDQISLHRFWMCPSLSRYHLWFWQMSCLQLEMEIQHWTLYLLLPVITIDALLVLHWIIDSFIYIDTSIEFSSTSQAVSSAETESSGAGSDVSICEYCKWVFHPFFGFFLIMLSPSIGLLVEHISMGQVEDSTESHSSATDVNSRMVIFNISHLAYINRAPFNRFVSGSFINESVCDFSFQNQFVNCLQMTPL